MRRILFAGLSLIILIIAMRFYHGSKPAQQSLVVINVLDEHEYVDCHIKGSRHVPFDDVESFAQNLHKDTQVIVYCSNYWCTASDIAAQQLIDLGFKSVYVYRAGMAEWYQAGFPVVGHCKEGYLTKIVANPHQQDIIPIITTEELKMKMEQAGLL